MLLASWLDLARLHKHHYKFAEFFAGRAHVSGVFRESKYRVASLDICYDDVVERKGGNGSDHECRVLVCWQA